MLVELVTPDVRRSPKARGRRNESTGGNRGSRFVFFLNTGDHAFFLFSDEIMRSLFDEIMRSGA